MRSDEVEFGFEGKLKIKYYLEREYGIKGIFGLILILKKYLNADENDPLERNKKGDF